MLWIAFIQWAIAVPTGHLLLQVSPEAQVKAFPRTQENRIEFGVYQNYVNIAPQLKGHSARWVTDMDAQAVGGGTTFITLYTSTPDVEAAFEMRPEGLLLSLKEGEPTVVTVPPHPTIDQLLFTDLPRRPSPPPDQKLISLPGDGQTLLLDPTQFPLPLPEWTPGPMFPHESEALSPIDSPTMQDIDRYRAILVETDGDSAIQTALFRIGQAYLSLGLPRDAKYYFSRLEHRAGFFPLSTLSLYQAKTALALHQPDKAMKACQKAYKANAPDYAVLQCVGLVSLSTSSPPPSQTARALIVNRGEVRNKGAITNDPNALLLAAELFLLDNNYDEAFTLLLGLPVQLDLHYRKLASAHLGDVYYARGDYLDAEKAWRDAGGIDTVGDVVHMRVAMMRLNQTTPNQWASQIPRLREVAFYLGFDAVEAHYLLAQIAEMYDDEQMAIDQYLAIVDRFPTIAVRTGIHGTLWNRCDAHLKKLHDKGLYAEEIGFYRDCWRDLFSPLISDPTSMENSASALEVLGLPEEALKVRLDAISVLTRHNTLGPRSLLALARLYLLVGKAQDTLDTLDYIDIDDSTRVYLAESSLIAGNALVALEMEDSAVIAWKQASKDPQFYADGMSRVALLYARAGQCELATPIIEGLTKDPDTLYNSKVQPDELLLALAFCEIKLGRFAKAVSTAQSAQDRAGDPWVREEAAHLAAIALLKDPNAAVPALIEEGGLWARLIKEEQDARIFAKKVKERAPTP